MIGQGIFDAEFYRLFRPFYPAGVFAGLEAELPVKSPLYSVLDIGCGTGHSAISLLKSGFPAEIAGIDPDPGMLEQARRLAQENGYADRLRFALGSAEKTGTANASADLILVGSAFHWMDPVLAEQEFRRVLRPRGVLRLFEYQFPKSQDLPELNEWVRRGFNQQWKAPGQVPRGDFRQVTRVFREQAEHWELLSDGRPEMRLELSHTEFAGLLLSQSRVHHYERTLDEAGRARFRAELNASIEGFCGGVMRAFDFKLEWVSFRGR